MAKTDKMFYGTLQFKLDLFANNEQIDKLYALICGKLCEKFH